MTLLRLLEERLVLLSRRTMRWARHKGRGSGKETPRKAEIKVMEKYEMRWDLRADEMRWGEQSGTMLDLDQSCDGGHKGNLSPSTLFSPALINIRSSPSPTPLLTSNTSKIIRHAKKAYLSTNFVPMRITQETRTSSLLILRTNWSHYGLPSTAFDKIRGLRWLNRSLLTWWTSTSSVEILQPILFSGNMRNATLPSPYPNFHRSRN